MDRTPPQPPPAEPTPTQLPPSAQGPLSPSAQHSAHTPNTRIFFGPFGLRAGWSLLIYFAILAGILGSLYLTGHQVHLHREHAAALAAAKAGKPAPPPTPLFPKPDPSKPAPMSLFIPAEFVIFLLYFVVSGIMARIEHRKLSAYGLGGALCIRRLGIGAFWGIAAISLLILLLRSLHLLAFDARLDHGPSILFWGTLQLLGFFLVGLSEEYSMRGYLQFTLTRGLVSLGNRISPPNARSIAFWIAAVLTSALFLSAHIHNAGENALGLLQVFLAGVLLVIALWRTGSLWWAIGFHTTWDWGQSFLFGVPDSGSLMQGRLFATHPLGNPLYSGGTVGPEGSILVIPIMLLSIVVLFFTSPSPQPPLELPDPQLPPSPHDPSSQNASLPNTSSTIA